MQKLTVIAAALLLTACAGQQAAPPAGDLSLNDRFLWVAFHGDQGQPHPLSRWEDPIRAVTVGASDRDRRKVEDHLALIAGLTGLDVSVDHAERGSITSPPDLTEAQNMVVMFGGENVLFRQVDLIHRQAHGTGYPTDRAFNCAAATYGEQPGQIHGSVIFIRNDIDPNTRLINYSRGCVAQEITQALGLTGDLDNHVDTIFSSQSIYVRPTATDRQIIELFYDRRLRPGMTESEAMPIVRQIIGERS